MKNNRLILAQSRSPEPPSAKPRRPSALAGSIALVASLLLPALAPAATLYWDSDGATAGAGVTGLNTAS